MSMTATLLEFLQAPWREAFFVKALLGGSLVAMVSGVVGCLVVLRRMAFLGDALSHAMIAGVAGGYLFMKLLFGLEAFAPAMLIGSLLAAVFTVMCIGFVSRISRVKEDTAIGVMYTGVFAGGVVLVSVFRQHIHIDLMHFIMGDVLAIADADLWAAAIAACLVLGAMLLFFRAFQLTSFDPVMAAAIGLPVALIDYALTVCVSLVVVSAVSMVGVILVVGLLITPAATAYLLCDRLDRMMLVSGGFGVSSVLLGLYAAFWMDSAGGGAVMLVCTLQFLVVLVVAPRHGLLARRLRLARMVPQQLKEDILIEILRADGQGLTQAALTHSLKDHPRDSYSAATPLPKALRRLTQQGLLERDGARLRLSEAGLAEATRLRRAHRLWETYLEHLGEPMEALHAKAQHLEHIHGPEAMAYLDDILAHPERDPHGEVIPRDPAYPAPGGLLPLSLLRQGDRGVAARIDPPAAGLDIPPGEHVLVRPRQEQGHAWVILLGNGRELRLDHAQADALHLDAVVPCDEDAPA